MTPIESDCLNKLIDLALAEDFGTDGDVTSISTIPEELQGRAAFVARSPGVLAGIEAAKRVCQRVDAKIEFVASFIDGDPIQKGDELARIQGPMRSILAAERTALNFLQHLSGIATLTSQFVDAVVGLQVKILDTRKTLPGWRALEKYAVRMGGGTNHRVGLFDMVLIKDNHLAAMENEIQAAIAAARTKFPSLPLEIEVETLEQLEIALASKPDIVLLDNMNTEMMREAVTRRNATAPDVKFAPAATLETVRAIAETGVDRISVGALTHSAAPDIALDYLPWSACY